MRIAREFYKPNDEDVYLHVYNHTVSLQNAQLPLGEQEKEKFIQIFGRYKVKYNLGVIGLVVMGNHFHTLLHCPQKKFTRDEAFAAFNTFHRKGKALSKDDLRVVGLQQHSNNISEFMREVQREFTLWFNKYREYKRKGALWQDRFQCQLIQSDVYLWGCLKYIEMNPVRAGITDNPADYKYSSFGRWKETHPYQQDFMEHILSLSSQETSMEEFKEYMAGQMKIMKANDRADQLEQQGQIEQEKTLREKIRQVRNAQEDLIILFADEEWHRKSFIGSKDFIKEKYRQWKLYRSSA